LYINIDIFMMFVITWIRNNDKELDQQLLFSLKMCFETIADK